MTESIQKRLKRLREQKGISQAALAPYIFPGETDHAAQGKIKRIETETREPTAVEVIRYAEFFQVSADWVLFGEDVNPHPHTPLHIKQVMEDVRDILLKKHEIVGPALVANVATFKLTVALAEKEQGQDVKIQALEQKVSQLEELAKSNKTQNPETKKLPLPTAPDANTNAPTSPGEKDLSQIWQEVVARGFGVSTADIVVKTLGEIREEKIASKKGDKEKTA
jgi:transcriptional regulator with XRE-family HTH domain